VGQRAWLFFHVFYPQDFRCVGTNAI
jgi:hypothetical protein